MQSDVVNTKQILDSCRQTLDQLSGLIHRRHWLQVKTCSDRYLSMIGQLQGGELSDESLRSMVQLEKQHRRAMRLIGEQMQQINAEIGHLDAGIRSARNNANIAAAFRGS